MTNNTNDDLVLVFSTGRNDLSALAKSMLTSASIPYMVKNEHIQGFWGYGNIAGRPLAAIGGIEFWTHLEDADDAKEILSGLDG